MIVGARTVDAPEEEGRVVCRMIADYPGTKRVIGLRKWAPGAWLFLVETTHSFPRFILGTTGISAETVRHWSRSNAFFGLAQSWEQMTGEEIEEKQEVRA